MLSHRAVFTENSKETFRELRDRSSASVYPSESCYVHRKRRGEGLYGLTHRLIFVHGFIMSSSQFGPFSKLILRTGRIHFSLELNDLALQLAIFTSVFRNRKGRSQVEVPYLFEIWKLVTRSSTSSKKEPNSTMVTYQIVDRACTNCIDDVYNEL